MTISNPTRRAEDVDDRELLLQLRRRGLSVIPDGAQHAAVHIERSGPTRLPTTRGTLTAFAYRFDGERVDHLALTTGVLGSEAHQDASARLTVHQECLLGDVAHATGCGCRQHLDDCIRTAAGSDRAVLVYLRRCRGAVATKPMRVLQILADLSVPLIDVGAGLIKIPTPDLVAMLLRQQVCGYEPGVRA